MNKLELYLNVIHFCYYKAHYKLHLLTNKINPFRLIHKLPFQKRRYEKLGIDIQKEIDSVFGNKNFGMSVTVAGGILLGLLFFLIFGVVGLIHKLFNTDNLGTIYFIIFGILSGIVCYVFVFKNDKYIKYFDKFDKWTRDEKRKYCWFTFIATIIVFCLWILSF
ncbi:hypothetical protein [Flavobacterium sp. '19STA2R22 D10 B1']|uniref:hypothetical protein n=1 Tax=Flavobacterium aerium TaxID=3037261 RepID=UPI00278BAEC9|nr:hypothetical protein [Flavobacterium sp. '19STA2R22 D10 B1']